MSEEPARLEAEWVQEGFMQPTRKRIKFQCPVCEHTWVRTFPAEPRENPPCPNKRCAEARELKDLKLQVANLTRMLESGQAPAHIGANPKVKAIDVTAQVTMEDNKLTDLKDNIRQGEAMAPKLPPPMQKAADGFFSGGANKALGSGETMAQRRMRAMGARAIAGGMRDMSIAPNQVLPKQRWSATRQPNAGYDSSRPTAEGNRRI